MQKASEAVVSIEVESDIRLSIEMLQYCLLALNTFA